MSAVCIGAILEFCATYYCLCAQQLCVCAVADNLDEDGCIQVWSGSVHDQIVLE